MLALYIDQAKRNFAFFGFVAPPLTDEQLTELYERDVPVEYVHNIACDVDAGFSFERAVRANYSGE